MSALLLTGCPAWDVGSREEDRALYFPAPPMVRDAVKLEIGVTQLDDRQSDDYEALFRWLDLQKIPVEARKALDRNGIQAGVVGAPAPSMLVDLVRPREIVVDELNDLEFQLHVKGHLKPESRMVLHEGISNRSGQTHPVTTSVIHPSYAWSIDIRSQRLAGAAKDVRGVFSVATFPNGDGSVRLVVTPEIHHGENRSRIGGANHGFRFESRQNIQRIRELAFEVVLNTGEALVIGPTSDFQALGPLFFGPGESPSDLEQLAEDALQSVPGEVQPSQPPVQEDTEEDAGVDLAAILGMSSSTDQEIEEIDRLFEAQQLGGWQADAKKPEPMHRMLIIRLVQTQLDELFGENETVEPLTNVNR